MITIRLYLKFQIIAQLFASIRFEMKKKHYSHSTIIDVINVRKKFQKFIDVYYNYCIHHIFTRESDCAIDKSKVRHCGGCITHCNKHYLKEPFSESQTTQEGRCKACSTGKR